MSRPVVAERLISGNASRFAALTLFLLCLSAISGVSARAGETADSNYDFRPRLLPDGAYSEGWDQLFYFADGTLLITQFTVTNLGIGDHRAGVFGLLITPDGKQTILKNSRRSGEWRYDKDKFGLFVARHYLQGQDRDYSLALQKKVGELEMTFKASAEPWRLGRIVENNEDYQYVYFYAPTARAEGRFRLAAPEGAKLGPWQELRDGRGFAVRYINTTGVGDLVQSATRIVAMSDEKLKPVLYVVYDRHGRQHSHLALFESGRLLHRQENIKFEFNGGVRRDLSGAMNIDVRTGEFSLSGTVVIKKLLVRVDPVDMIKSYVRFIVRLMNTPLQYRYLAQYDLSYSHSGGTQRLSGHALVDHMVMKDVEDEAQRK